MIFGDSKRVVYDRCNQTMILPKYECPSITRISLLSIEMGEYFLFSEDEWKWGDIFQNKTK